MKTPIHKLSEAELLERYFQKEDIESLGFALQRYTTVLLGIGMRYLKDIHTVQDIIQQVYIKAIEKLPLHISNLGGWLYMVMKNECMDYLRKSNLTFVEEFEDSSDEELSVEAHWQKVQHEESLTLILNELKEEHKLALKMFYFESLTYHQIADKTGWTINEVKSYIQNGKRNLKIRMEKENNNL